MRLLLTALGLALVLLPSAAAAPDAYGVWKKGIKAAEKQEAEYWDRFDGRLRYVYEDWTSKWRLWSSDPDGFKDERVPLDGIRELYDDYVELQVHRGEVHRSFARSAHEKALTTLFDEIMDLAKDVDRMEKELAEARPTGGRSAPRYEQALPVRRHGAEAAMDALLDAVALVPGASAFLAGEAFEEAVKGDKKRSLVRRTAVMDGLGRIRDDVSRDALAAQLSAPEPFLRVLAVENLMAFGGEAVPLLKPAFADPSPVVRRALFDAVRERAAHVTAWVPVLIDALERTKGVERVRLLAALEALSGQPLGNDAAAWTTWYEGAKAAIDDGTFRRPERVDPDKPPPPPPEDGEGDAEEAEPAPEGDRAPPPEVKRGPEVEPRISFYGVRSPSTCVVFLVDGSRFMDLPADLATQTSRADTWWRQTGPKWKEEMADHHAYLLQQMEWTIDALPEDARFGVIHQHGSTPSKLDVMGGRKLLSPAKGTKKSVLKALQKARPEGLLSLQEGLSEALAMCGSEDCENPEPGEAVPDTIYLVNTGWNGGRYPLPEVLLAWWRRANRFHRLTVHAIRICDEKEEAERLMRGLAEQTVGTYLWLQEL